MEKYINLFTDFGFKRVFAQEANKPLLLDFVNQLKGAAEEKLFELYYETTEQQGRNKRARRSFYDLHFSSPTGRHFIIELQRRPQLFFKDRMLFYSSVFFQAQAPQGDWDYALKPLTLISILNFELDKAPGPVCRKIALRDEQQNELFYKGLTFFTVEIPKFKKKLEELSSPLDCWLYAFKHLHELEHIPPIMDYGVFRQLFNTAKIAAMTPSEQYEYEQNRKFLLDRYSELETAKHEGLEKGIEKGRAEGIEKGAQQQAKLIALRGIRAGWADEQIALLTALPIEEVKKLRKAYEAGNGEEAIS